MTPGLQARRALQGMPCFLLVMVTMLLAGCASRPPASRTGSDGPPTRPPPDLQQVPDAVPRVEPLRVGGPNKPYEVLGQRYVPVTSDQPLTETGGASWYGRKFHGQPTSSGETYDMYAMTAAHKTMPIPSYARVRNPTNGREVVVRINDRGPFSPGRVIDLSFTAALKLGVLAGVAPVQVQRLTFDDIRHGRWQTQLPAAMAEDPAPGDTPAATAGHWLQLGAFRTRDAAVQLQQRVLRNTEAATPPSVAVFEEEGWFRVQAGPYDNRAQALDAAERLRRTFGLAPVALERR